PFRSRFRMLPAPDPSVVFQRLGDGAVLFAPASETYFELNVVGARVWELLPPVSSTLEELCDVIGHEYPDVPSATIEQDVVDLLTELRQESLVGPPPSLDGPAAP